MEWFFPYYWPIVPMQWSDWPAPPPRDPPAEDECGDPSTLELDVIRVVYEVLVEEAGCAICGAPLQRVINIELRQRFFRAAEIVVSTNCRGWRRHRQVATVLHRDGDLLFGQLGTS